MVDIFAPAKVNLFLHVTGKHEGYHTLQTVCFFPTIGDRLTVNKRLPFSKEDELQISGPFAADLPEEPKQNIILKVLTALREQHEIPYYSIHLQKRLPVSAGVGGGSADVAAVLRVIAQDTKLDFLQEPLAGKLASLGADILACYHSQPLLAEGIGDEIQLWESMPDFGILLVNPRVPLSTKEVFERAQNFSSPAMISMPKSLAGWHSLIKATDNDLQPVAETLVPEILHMIDALKDTHEVITARMTGSGATCFALYPSIIEAQVAEVKLRDKYPQWWIQAAKVYDGTAS